MSSLESLGETLIPVIDKLQGILHGAQLPDEWKVQLPEVAVVGSQSSGKSSVLESLVGRDFLPRGPGICTRRPLILHLRRIEADEEYAEFTVHMPGRRFTDFAAIREEIDHETTRLLGNTDKDISDRPIHLSIFSPHVLTMSLIDLPGMTRIPVKGQPDDIADKLERMIMSYIRNPSCIILAVSAANTDLANSDAIAMARLVDPEGLRTIGVLTKIDIMDRGTNALSMLRNEVLPLRLGYTAVVNRSQHDIQERTPVTKARENEAAFFQTNAMYKPVEGQCGIPALSKRIHTVLVRHIEERLPALREAITSHEHKARVELESLGSALSDSNAEALREALLRLLELYCGAFRGCLSGRQKRQQVVAQDSTLQGGARIRHVFQQIFGAVLDDLDPCCGMTDEEIWATMNNCAGVSRDVMLSQDALEAIVHKTLEQLRNPGLQCLAMVTQELLRIGDQCTPTEILRFPELQDRIHGAMRRFISGAGDKAKSVLISLFECELAYVNTDHPDYVGMQRAWKEHMAAKEGTGGSDSDSADGRHDRQRGHSHSQALTVPRAGHHAFLTFGDSHAAHPHGHGTQNGDDRSRATSDEEGGGWGLQRLWRRGDNHTPQGPRSEGSEPPGDGFGSVIGGRATSPGARPRTVFLPSAPTELRIKISNETEKDTVMVMRRVVASYFAIVRNTMKDLVPKVIMRFVVNHAVEAIHGHLISKILSGDEKRVMQERQDIAGRRKDLTATCEVLSKAVAELQLLPRELEAQAGIGPRSGGSAVGQLMDVPELSGSIGSSTARVASRSLEMYQSLNMSTVGH
eukprot:jgi/Ulvmu1/402/UM001_0409.1